MARAQGGIPKIAGRALTNDLLHHGEVHVSCPSVIATSFDSALMVGVHKELLRGKLRVLLEVSSAIVLGNEDCDRELEPCFNISQQLCEGRSGRWK